MIELKNKLNQRISGIKFIEILFYTFPLSFIIGNLLLSIHLLLFITVSFFIIKKEQLRFRLDKSYWILIVFFSYIFLLTTIQYHIPGTLYEVTKDWPFKINPTFKSLIFVRFLIFLFIIDILFVNKILNLKKFLLISLICTSFVSFDVILQYITGSDLFGYKSLGDKNPGPFGNEWIAGSYLQKFSFFSIFYVVEINKNIKFKNTLLIFIIVFHLVALLIAGNRMPLLLFLFACVLIIFFIKNLRIVMTVSLIIFLAISSFVIKNDPKIKSIYDTFYKYSLKTIEMVLPIGNNDVAINSENEIKESKDKTSTFLRTTGHGALYRTTIEIWKEQPLFGYGLKSFRVKCWEVLPKDKKQAEGKTPGSAQKFHCSTHSHNYYLELLLEAGIIGISLIIIFFIILLKNSFYLLKKYNQRINSEIVLVMPFVVVLFIEIWPIRSSGSFFTTWNATFLWLVIAIIFTHRQKKSN